MGVYCIFVMEIMLLSTCCVCWGFMSSRVHTASAFDDSRQQYVFSCYYLTYLF